MSLNDTQSWLEVGWTVSNIYSNLDLNSLLGEDRRRNLL